MNIKGQGHTVTLVQDHSDSTFSKFLSLEKAKPIEAKFHVDGRCSVLNEYMKIYEYQSSVIDLGHSDSVLLRFFSSITPDFNISSALRWAIQDQWYSGLSWRPILQTNEDY